jgi:outer membrane protein assembly factor BamE (lipoprotein component of BamABCDE complex)
MNYISIGMTKQQAVELLGPPMSTSAKNNVEYLRYRMKEDGDKPGARQEYFVRIIDGKVESYGRMGDFDSAKVPEKKETIDLNMNK